MTRTIRYHPVGYTAEYPCVSGSIQNEKTGQLSVKINSGGHVAATLYSLVGTCKLNRIEPYAYLRDVLQRLPSHPINRLAELLPFNWKAAVF